VPMATLTRGFHATLVRHALADSPATPTAPSKIGSPYLGRRVRCAFNSGQLLRRGKRSHDWQGVSSRRQAWSEQPCVRPVSAVHMTAGHNALRGSGPGQKHAFDNALAQVGCPDRRVDRLCITCCSPFRTTTSRRMSGRDLVHAASATGSL
jgi:hypothetical protein